MPPHKPRKKRLTQQDLRTTAALIARRIGADGRARLEQLAPDRPWKTGYPMKAGGEPRPDD
jgi:hypothetical protein